MSLTGQQTRRNSDSGPVGRLQPANSGPGSRKGTEWAKMPPRKTWLLFMLILLTNYFLVRLLMPSAEAPVTVPYTVFKEEVRKGNVEAIYSRGDTMSGRFTAPITYPPAGDQNAAARGEPKSVTKRGSVPRSLSPKTASTFETTLPSFADPGLEAFLIENKVEISAEPIQEGDSPLATLLFSFGPAMLFIGFYIWLFRRAYGHRQEHSPPLRPGERCEGHFR